MIPSVETSYSAQSVWCLVIFGLLVGFLYHTILRELVVIWSQNENYGHGFLIIPASGYLLWRRRRLIISQPLYPSRLGIPVMLLWAVLYLLGVGARILTFSCASLIVFLLGVLLCTAGRYATGLLLFPVLYLFFMIPVPSEVYTLLTNPLQLIATGSSACILNLFHIPVFREGNLIHLPNYSMQVALACSGLRSLVSVVALSLLMGHLLFSSNIERALLLLISVPAAMLGNILRITLTGFMVYRGSPYVEVQTSHAMAGIMTFCLSFIILIGGVFLIRWIERKRMQYISWYLR